MSYRLLKDEPPPMSTLEQMTTSALDYVVKTCLAKDPDDRWQSTDDVGRQVNGFIEGRSQTSVAVPITAATGRRGWRRLCPGRRMERREKDTLDAERRARGQHMELSLPAGVVHGRRGTRPRVSFTPPQRTFPPAHVRIALEPRRRAPEISPSSHQSEQVRPQWLPLATCCPT